MGLVTQSGQREFHVTCDTEYTQAGTTNIMSFATSSYSVFTTKNMVAYQNTIWSAGIKSLSGNNKLLI